MTKHSKPNRVARWVFRIGIAVCAMIVVASAGVEPATSIRTTWHTGQVCGLAGITSTKDSLLRDLHIGARPTRACPSHTATIHARERGMLTLTRWCYGETFSVIRPGSGSDPVLPVREFVQAQRLRCNFRVLSLDG